MRAFTRSNTFKCLLTTIKQPMKKRKKQVQQSIQRNASYSGKSKQSNVSLKASFLCIYVLFLKRLWM